MPLGRFDQGVAQLHSFYYFESERSFRQAAKIDPDCAMAYWGMAISVWNQIWAPPTPANLKKGSDAIARALADRSIGGRVRTGAVRADHQQTEVPSSA